MKFSENLKHHIQEHNLSLKELAIKLNVPPSTVHGWLNGIPPKNILTIKKIADLFNCSLDKLCFNEEFEKIAIYIFDDLIEFCGPQAPSVVSLEFFIPHLLRVRVFVFLIIIFIFIFIFFLVCFGFFV